LRKLREWVIARRLEAELSKARILELYLNVIEWGDGVYGVESASRAYFSKSAAELDAPESALLAAAIVNPRVLNPAHPGTRLPPAAAHPAPDGGGGAAGGFSST
jgi:monofunctional biosynthetic peptidoglycan transglycosylase